MKPYPDYKPTGLAWLPEIPKHWDWIMLSQIATEQCNKNAERTERNVLSLSYGRIIQKKNLFAGLSPQDYGTYQIISPGNIVMRLTDLQNDHKSLRTGLAEMRGIITSAYTCLKTNHNPAFLHYLLHCYDIRKVFYGLGGGVRQSIGFKDIRGLRFPFPPADEQAQIVRYLDAMTAKINKLIRAKKRQIALLQEQKQAIINQAVTRGLDPDVELKDSGIDWLGPIPKPWKIMTMSRLSQTVRGASPRPAGDSRFFEGNTIPWITVSELTKDESKYLEKTATYLTEEGQKQSRTINSDTLLLSNSGATLGVPKISHIMGCINDGVVAFLSPKENIEFLYYALKNQTINLRKIVEGYGQPNLNTTIVKNIIVAIPPLNIQHDIVEYLDKKCSDINFIIEQYQKIIEQYIEYKNSLIAAVVTGQVDVRNIAVEVVSPEDLAPSDDPDESEEQDSPVSEESEE